jgi:very-short-patch-repair endonuclease
LNPGFIFRIEFLNIFRNRESCDSRGMTNSASARLAPSSPTETLGERLASSAADFIARAQRPELAATLEATVERLSQEAAQLPCCNVDTTLGAVVVRMLAQSTLCETVSPVVLACARKCGSPIEFAFCFAMGTVARARHHAVLYDLGYGIVMGDAEGCDTLRIQPQAKLNGARVDFLVTYQAIEDEGEGVELYQRQVVVECDGHDFHERTKEQAARDRERDRGLQGLGLNVFRYTGAEIWRDVFGCAEDLLDFLAKGVKQDQYQAGLKKRAASVGATSGRAMNNRA